VKYLILYSTIVGAFYAQTEELESAIGFARDEAGEDVWKRGYSGKKRGGATLIALSHFEAAGIQSVAVEGYLQHVSFVDNRDKALNHYPKLRVGVLTESGDQLMLSLDLKGDVAQRMIVKLRNCTPGEFVTITAWVSPVERAGRQYINHAVSMKDVDGTEIPSDSAFSAQVKAACDTVAQALKTAGINDKKVVATAKANKRIESHKDLLLQIQAVFTEAALSSEPA